MANDLVGTIISRRGRKWRVVAHQLPSDTYVLVPHETPLTHVSAKQIWAELSS